MGERIKALFAMIKELVRLKFTGSIEIHFSQGGVTNVIKHEKVQ